MGASSSQADRSADITPPLCKPTSVHALCCDWRTCLLSVCTAACCCGTVVAHQEPPCHSCWSCAVVISCGFQPHLYLSATPLLLLTWRGVQPPSRPPPLSSPLHTITTTTTRGYAGFSTFLLILNLLHPM